MVDTFQALISLRANVDAFMEKVAARHRLRFACAATCSGCCLPGLSVFPVEAVPMAEAVSKLPREVQGRLALQKDNEEHCVFLLDDLCSIYDQRPIICRSQGLPLLLEDGEVDLCPEHVRAGLRVEDLAPEDVLALERLNTMLVVLQRTWSRQTKLSNNRIPLADLL